MEHKIRREADLFSLASAEERAGRGLAVRHCEPRRGEMIIARAFKPWKKIIIKTQVPLGTADKMMCVVPLGLLNYIGYSFQALKCLATIWRP